MKASEMKKTPSALKWLAEKRARLAGALKSAEQVSQCLGEDLEELRQRMATLEVLQGITKRRAKA